MSQRKDFKPKFGDVSIYDFANATVAGRRGRLSKGVVTPISTVERISKVGGTDGLRWEQHLEENDTGEDFDLNGNSKTSPEAESEAVKPYLILPMDIWFAIGDHIPPEGVKVFASICKSTQKVANSARFWIGLYKRYYEPSALKSLPLRLQPQNVKIRGLKSSVIRALYLMYPPFIESLKPQRKTCDLQHIVRRKCINYWYTSNSKMWTYWFKLKQVNLRKGRCPSLSSNNNKKLLEIEQDMAANEEKDTKVLQVSCPHFVPLPAVHGLTLKRALVTLSQDNMTNKLTLTFDNVDVVVNPASNIQLLDWWHPQYPHINDEVKRKTFNMSFCDKDRNDIVGAIIDHWYDV